jgi:hypothetical protein
MNIKDLKIVRVTMPETFEIIPRYLFEQIEGLGFGEDRIENIYRHGLSILMVPISQNSHVEWVPNPLVHIALMYDKEHIIKGFVWSHVDLVDKHIFVHARE